MLLHKMLDMLLPEHVHTRVPEHVAASFVQDRSMVRPSLASVLDVQVLA